MKSTPQMMTLAEKATRYSRRLVKMGAVLGRGGRFIASRSTGSTPSDCEGGPSMMTLMKRICIALSGFGSPSAVERVMRDRAATAVESWKQRKFWMLTKMPELLEAGPRQHVLPGLPVAAEREREEKLTLALLDRWQEGGKVVVDEDHVGRLFGNIGTASPHRDADVGHPQSRRIIDCR